MTYQLPARRRQALPNLSDREGAPTSPIASDDMEGHYEVFLNTQAQLNAHPPRREDNAEVTQMAAVEEKALHAGDERGVGLEVPGFAAPRHQPPSRPAPFARLRGHIMKIKSGWIALAAMLAIAACFSSPSAAVPSQESCLAYDDVLAAATAAHRQLPGSRLMEFVDQEAVHLVNVLQMDFEAERVLVLQYEDGTANIGFGSHGCFEGAALMSARNWEKVRDRALGVGI